MGGSVLLLTKSDISTLWSSEQLDSLERDYCGGDFLLTVAPSAVLTDTGISDTVEPVVKTNINTN